MEERMRWFAQGKKGIVQLVVLSWDQSQSATSGSSGIVLGEWVRDRRVGGEKATLGEKGEKREKRENGERKSCGV